MGRTTRHRCGSKGSLSWTSSQVRIGGPGRWDQQTARSETNVQEKLLEHEERHVPRLQSSTWPLKLRTQHLQPALRVLPSVVCAACVYGRERDDRRCKVKCRMTINQLALETDKRRRVWAFELPGGGRDQRRSATLVGCKGGRGGEVNDRCGSGSDGLWDPQDRSTQEGEARGGYTG